MNGFRNWRVGVKLVSGFLLVAAIAAVIGGLGLRSTSQVNQMATLMYSQEVMGMRSAAQAQLRLVAAARSARTVLLAPDKGARIAEIYTLRDHLEGARSEIQKLYALMTGAEAKETLDNIAGVVASYSAALEGFVASFEASGLEIDSLQTLARFEMALSQAMGSGDLAEMLIAGLVLNKQNTSSELAGETTLIYEQSLLSLSLLTLLGTLVALFLGAFLARGLTRQLGGEPHDVVRVVNAVAQGDLTPRVDLQRARQGSIMAAMEHMRESLAKAVGHVHRSSDSIAICARQITVGNTDLARRSETQVADLTETAAAMEVLSGTVAANAGVAQQVAEMALSARDFAERGGQVVEQVISTMADITEASRRVADIIALIDSIAFQTNILALNAAVEAARAGDQGRGFAVVANEVRNLAQRSAAAASDIKLLIANSDSKVNGGSNMVTQAGSVMADIVLQVSQVADLIQDISRATQEQTEGIAQVNAAIANLMQANHENATIVDHSAQAAQDLSYQASHLLDAMDVFHLGANTQPEIHDDLTPLPFGDLVSGRVEAFGKDPMQADPALPRRLSEMTGIAYRPMLA